jgi:putative ABC transport system permease protein
VHLARAANRGGGADALREGSRGLAGGKRSTFVRASLVVAQVSVALVLLVVSGLFARSLLRLQQENTGVRGAEQVMSVLLPLPRARTLDTAAHTRFFDDALRRVRDIPGVTTAGVSSHLPLTGGGESKSFWIEGHEPATETEIGSVVGRMESASSLQSIGAALIRGRWFQETDRSGAPHVAIISEGVARKFFQGQDPIGQRISLHPPEALRPKSALPPSGRWPRWTIIGVVKDVKYASPRDEPERAVYVHYPQGLQTWPWGPRWLVVRTSQNPSSLAVPIRAALRSIDPTIPVGTMLPLDERMALSLRAPRFTATLVTAFAIVAVLLGAIGLYGVIAYSVSRETRAFGVRVALGATASDVARHVIVRGMRLAVVGIVVGVASSLVATRWIESQLFGITAVDPFTYALAVAGLFALTLVASYLPARRAARVDPVIALRTEG